MSAVVSSLSALRYDRPLRCPLCRIGVLVDLALMIDSLGCRLCDRLFSLDGRQNVLTLVDSLPALRWQWNGRNWTAQHAQMVRTSDKIVAAALVILPTAVIGLCAYFFRPTPGSPLAWLPPVWTVLTFLCHTGCVLLAVSSYYQFSPSACGRALGRLVRIKAASK
ncbi:hypothetical protein [Gloeobacter kilaueensis]|uniref:Uncharacterized protein n=1 Tax=Gloeobacter kilaueensis (strain ATCC BAA-2537 / CCAP 1431/1 / ULC 316 / JS1) TaxID=1183438 RepID=U5QKN1_GLOK1|nr:hypothetical protein [Gloeobacter kilaueensis]AGY58240.1 hypothetical protein GKIL_1994 [Gloeobacter kilaueensis JS1]